MCDSSEDTGIHEDWVEDPLSVEEQIHVDIILGYPWMRKMGYLVDPVHDCF